MEYSSTGPPEEIRRLVHSVEAKRVHEESLVRERE